MCESSDTRLPSCSPRACRPLVWWRVQGSTNTRGCTCMGLEREGNAADHRHSAWSVTWPAEEAEVPFVTASLADQTSCGSLSGSVA